MNRGEEPDGAEKKFGEIWGKPRRNAVSSMGKRVRRAVGMSGAGWLVRGSLGAPTGKTGRCDSP